MMRVMNRNEAVSKLKDCADAVKARGATSLLPVRFYHRDEAKPDSDVDLFVDYDPKKEILSCRFSWHQVSS